MFFQSNAAHTAPCAAVFSCGAAFCCANTGAISMDAAFAASIFIFLVLVCLLPLSGLIVSLIMIGLLPIILLTITPPHGPGPQS